MTKSFKQVRTIIKVWDKAKKISGYDPDMWRQDFAGAWIRRDAYGCIKKLYPAIMTHPLLKIIKLILKKR